MRIFLRGIAALVAAFFMSATVSAAIYRGEGVASLEMGRVAARQAAIDDAVRWISMTQGGQLRAASISQNGDLAEALMAGPEMLKGRTKVIAERVQDGLLMVTVELDTAAPQDGPVNACPKPALSGGRALQRAMLVTYFEVPKPQDAGDLGNLATWLPARLAARMAQYREVRGLDASTVSLFPEGRVMDPWQAVPLARELGRREGVQLILAGRVLDSGVTRKEPRMQIFGNSEPNQQGAYYIGPMAGFLGIAARTVPVERRFAVEYWLYDGLSGGVLSRGTVDGVARGSVSQETPRLFDVANLFQTDYGRLIDGQLSEIARRLAAEAACLPFASRVVRVEGDRVYLSAGALDGLAETDRLIVYKQQPSTEIRRGDGEVLGVPERIIGDLELIQVQSRFAIAVMRNSRGKVEVGDWVRFPVR